MFKNSFGVSIDRDDDYIHPHKLDRHLRRRHALTLFGAAAGAAFLGGCGTAISSQAITSETPRGTTNTGTDGVASNCSVIPTETIGPYPADGSNSGTDALHQSSIYRANVTGGKTGVQVTDISGQANFTTIFPGWYTGRYTHIHFEVFLNNALSSRAAKTSQFTFPQEVMTSVYSSSLYSAHGQNTSVTSASRDGIFADGVALQTATVSGSVGSGLAASIKIGI